jgi:hypothetical protein
LDLKLKRKIGELFASREFVRSAIDDKADMSAFREKPTAKIIFGIFLILFSYLMAWPTISALGIISIYYRNPFFVAIGGPVLYGLSYLVLLAGVYLAGVKYTKVLMRYGARKITEKLLE